MRMVAWVEGRKSPYTPSIRPYTSEYTARILLQYFEYTDKYLKMCGLPHTGVGVWNWLYGFLTPPPIFRVLNSFFHIPWAHGTTRCV